jgi:hypothetical protein
MNKAKNLINRGYRNIKPKDMIFYR